MILLAVGVKAYLIYFLFCGELVVWMDRVDRVKKSIFLVQISWILKF